MKKVYYLVVALLLVVTAFAGCRGASADKVYDENDKNINVKAGETFTIQLEANPTTGYDWAVSIGDESVVSYVKTDYEQEPADMELVGAGGMDNIVFKGLKSGTTAVTLTYERSFEEGSALQTLVYNVTVE